MAVLTNKSIASTYKSVLSIGATTESALTSSIQQLTDGLGNGSPLSMSTTQIQFNSGSNTFKFPATRGASGKILKLADANGTLDWADDSVASTLNFSGSTSGTGSIALNTQTLAFTGTANQITAIAGSQAITFAFPSGGVTLPNGSIATTQSASDNSTKVATTAYVDTAVGSTITKSGSPSANQIAIWASSSAIKGMSAIEIDSNNKITLSQTNSSGTNTGSYIIGGGNINNHTGTNNVGFGLENLNVLTTGSFNTALGYRALKSVTTAVANVAIGYQSLEFSDTILNQDNNVAVGTASGRWNKGSNNTFIGYRSGMGSTTAANNTGVANTALGYLSLNALISGNSNTAVGTLALEDNTTGLLNTCLGHSSGKEITTGSKNVIIGSFTGNSGGTDIRTSSNNIIISDGDGNVRLQVDSSGNVGIATTPTDYYGGADNLVVKQASGEGGITIVTADNTNGALYFAQGTTGNEPYRGGIYYDHANDKLHLTTVGTSKIKIASSATLMDSDGSGWYFKSYLLSTDGAAANYKWQTYINASDNNYRINSRSKGEVFEIGYATGNIGINRTPSSDYKLYMMGDTTTSAKYIFVTLNSDGYGVLHARNDGAVYAGLIATDSGTDLVLNSSGFICKKSSSIRYKKDVENIDIGLDFILSLNPVKYNLKSNDQKQVGFIAEDFPDERFVSYSQVDTKDESKGIQKEAVNYSQLTAVLTKAIQEQQTIIEDLKSRIEKLEL